VCDLPFNGVFGEISLENIKYLLYDTLKNKWMKALVIGEFDMLSVELVMKLLKYEEFSRFIVTFEENEEFKSVCIINIKDSLFLFSVDNSDIVNIG
jgi:hypothetical protein